jgi:hypothetical protein
MKDEGGMANRQSLIVNRQWRQRPSLICVPSYRCVGERPLGIIVPKEAAVRNGRWAACQAIITAAGPTRRRDGDTGRSPLMGKTSPEQGEPLI